MPTIIYNKESGEVLKDTPENRKLTFHTICGSDHNLYRLKYKNVAYGESYFYSPYNTDHDILRKAGLLEENKQYLVNHYSDQIKAIEQAIEKLEGFKLIIKSEHAKDSLHSTVYAAYQHTTAGLDSAISELEQEIRELEGNLRHSNRIK